MEEKKCSSVEVRTMWENKKGNTSVHNKNTPSCEASEGELHPKIVEQM
jgi:hypothetical protein